jgi:hypothetical protein
MEEEERPVHAATGITIPKYDEQLRILREAIVELRSLVQFMRSKGTGAVVLALDEAGRTKVAEEEEEAERPGVSGGDSESWRDAFSLRLRTALKRHMADVTKMIEELREELHATLEHRPTTKDQPKKRPVTRQRSQERLRMIPVAPIEGTLSDKELDRPRAPTKPSALGNVPNALIVTQPEIPTKAVRKATSPRISTDENAPGSQELPRPPGIVTIHEKQPDAAVQEPGHFVPQVIHEMQVRNAGPEQQAILDAILPQIGIMQVQMESKCDATIEKVHQMEQALEQKVDKEFINDFFRKIRLMIVDMKHQMENIKQQVPDRVTREELKDVATELYSTLTKETSTTAGRVSYNCLFCGRPRSSVSGMITDQAVADSLGEPQKTRVGGTIMYGSDKQMYMGRGNFGRPTTANMVKSPPLPKLIPTQDGP